MAAEGAEMVLIEGSFVERVRSKAAPWLMTFLRTSRG